MTDAFPYVEVPEELHRVVGEPLPGTRLYRKDAPDSEVSYWSDALFEHFGQLVSPGGVAMYAPVSRASVHQRIKDGKLTAFFLYVTTAKRNWFGQTRVKREMPYGFIPVVECKAWKAELEERAKKKGLVTREDLEGEKPDWDGWFLEWNSRFVRERLARAREVEGGRR